MPRVAGRHHGVNFPEADIAEQPLLADSTYPHELIEGRPLSGAVFGSSTARAAAPDWSPPPDAARLLISLRR